MTNDLPNGWAEATLSDMVMRPRPKVAPSDHSELPFIGMDHIASHGMKLLGSIRFGDMKSNGGLFFEGDVLYGRMRPYLNKVHSARSSGACSAEFIVFPQSQGIDSDFLAYLLHSRSFVNFASDLSSGDRPRVDFDSVADYPVLVPPIAEQERIVSKIDELFSSIDEGERALERVRKLVERYRQSVLKAAVTGELTREWREKHAGELESGESLLTRIIEARRKAWEKSELDKMKAKGQRPANSDWKKKYKEPAWPDTSDLPELPEGWVWASPVQLEDSIPNALTIGPFGSNLKVSDYEHSGVPLIFVRNIRSQRFGGERTKYVTPRKAEELASHKARACDVLITKMGEPPGDACVYPVGSPDAVITSDCIKWTLHKTLPRKDYFANFINSYVGRSQFAEITKGVAQQKVSLDRFRQIAIALPGLTEQEIIADRLEVEFERLLVLEQMIQAENDRSSALRQSVLSAAFSGKLTEQDPADEPASVLLERIAAERTERIPQKKQPVPKATRNKKVKA